MKYILALASLVGVSMAQISASCKSINFDSTTDVLSAECDPRDHSGYVPSQLDLNDCFGYDGTKITPTRGGNYGDSCDDCHLYMAPDPFYGGDIYWMNCTCAGQSAEVAVPVEDAFAHQYVTNNNGHLVSSDDPTNYSSTQAPEQPLDSYNSADLAQK